MTKNFWTKRIFITYSMSKSPVESKGSYMAPAQPLPPPPPTRRSGVKLLDKANIAFRNRVEPKLRLEYPDVDMSKIEIMNDAILALIEVLEKELSNG